MNAAALIAACATVGIFIFAFAQWAATDRFGRSAERTDKKLEELQERLNYLTASLETHSLLQLRIAAKQAGIPAVWFDPTKEAVTYGQHGTLAELVKIRIFLPEQLREQGLKIAPKFELAPTPAIQ